MSYKVGLSTNVFDANGAMRVPVTADSVFSMDSGSRRVTRTATLDGECTVYDTGFAASDSTFEIISKDPDESISDFFEYLVKNYSSVNLATRNGFYHASPSRWAIRDNKPTLILLITEQAT